MLDEHIWRLATFSDLPKMWANSTGYGGQRASDGLGNVGGDSRALLRDAREAMRGGVRIDTIGLGKGQDAALLQALASESGGIYQAF